jgi:hypothetical protein
MMKYQDVVISRGLGVIGAQVAVTNYPSGSPATIYSDNGVTLYPSNVLTTDNNGRYYFYAANGYYSLSISGYGLTTLSITDILLQDLVSGSTGTNGILFKLAGANMNITTDQAITGLPAKYQITGVTFTNASTSLTTAIGGIYTGAGKTGSQVIYAGQSYATLTSSSLLLQGSFAIGALETAYTASTLYFSLTTPQGAAATCDVYVIGTTLT